MDEANLYQDAIERIREGNYRFTSKVRGQSSVVLEELVDPDGEAIATLADSEGDQGALALSIALDVITFETWLFGQIGDVESLDLDRGNHEETWFNFGAWIGELLRLRHGGHWLIPGDDPKSWRLGFSKIMLEIIPWFFSEQLLRSGPGAVKRLLGEIERLRLSHEEQAEKNGGQEIDRYTAEHYVRLHTVPLGQWMVMDFDLLERLWNKAPAKELAKELRSAGKKLGEQNAPILTKVLEAVEGVNAAEPIVKQAPDRGLFEAVAQIVGLRRTTQPVAVDILEKMILPALHIGVPDKFPPLDSDDLAQIRKGIELFALFVDIVPHKFQADDEGFLGSIPQEDLASPYGEKSVDVGKGDWVVVKASRFKEMFIGFDSKRLLARYMEFVEHVKATPKAPHRRDDGRHLAEMVANSLADLRACITAAAKENHSLVFRLLPPP